MAELKRQRVDAETRIEQQNIQKAKKTFAFIEETKVIEATKAALDVAGTIDPTPAADGMSCSLALVTGDYWGAFWSVVSMVPYVGDLVGKPAKAMKAAWKVEELAELMARATKRLAKAQKIIRHKKIEISKKVSEIIRAQRAKAGKGNCKYGSTIPARGTWKPKDDPGNGIWMSENGHVVPYKNGYPQFDNAYKMENGVRVPAAYPNGKVEIPDMVGDSRPDFKAANKAMQEKLGDTPWKKPDKYTWHHGEDATSMTLVRSEFHHGTDGANHTGGTSIARDREF